MFETIFGPFALPFVQRGLTEVLFLSVGAGLLGTWIVLRGLAFYSHAVGMAAFPGLVLADGLGFAAPIGAFFTAVFFAGGSNGSLAARRPATTALPPWCWSGWWRSASSSRAMCFSPDPT